MRTVVATCSSARTGAPPTCERQLPEHGVTLSPDLAVLSSNGDKPLMLDPHLYGQDVDLDATLKLDGWASHTGGTHGDALPRHWVAASGW
jgi:hypothetical protein